MKSDAMSSTTLHIRPVRHDCCSLVISPLTSSCRSMKRQYERFIRDMHGCLICCASTSIPGACRIVCFDVSLNVCIDGISCIDLTDDRFESEAKLMQSVRMILTRIGEPLSGGGRESEEGEEEEEEREDGESGGDEARGHRRMMRPHEARPKAKLNLKGKRSDPGGLGESDRRSLDDQENESKTLCRPFHLLMRLSHLSGQLKLGHDLHIC